jgi:hypothetical protein
MIGKGGRLYPVPTESALSGPKLFIPESVVAELDRLLPSYGGEADHEGVLYLGGFEVPRAGSAVSVALAPNADTSWGSFVTDLDANSAVVNALGDLSLGLVGQIHSHPGEWVDHSDGDDEGALVRFEGYWSIVVPRFAARGVRPLSGCGVHLFTQGAFRRLTAEAVERRVRVLPAALDLRGSR